MGDEASLKLIAQIAQITRSKAIAQGDPLNLATSDNPGTLICTVQLDGGDFYAWSRQIRMGLKTKLKLGFLDGSVPRPEKDSSDFRRWSRANGMITCRKLQFKKCSKGNKVSNNMARFLVIIWLIFILIITQSYTTNLASMLIVNCLKPMVTDINELAKRNQPVSYQYGSFVKEFLQQKKLMKLKSYSSTVELHDLLVKGIREGDQMVAIEKKWFDQQQSCPESSAALII
ncbi:hypothetical protein V2J09_022240 [Rumex salicifolius]